MRAIANGTDEARICPRGVMAEEGTGLVGICVRKGRVWMKKQLTRFTTSFPVLTAPLLPYHYFLPSSEAQAIARGRRERRNELRGNATTRASLHETAAIKERLTSMRRSPGRE